jgi:hypothetical protein
LQSAMTPDQCTLAAMLGCRSVVLFSAEKRPRSDRTAWPSGRSGQCPSREGPCDSFTFKGCRGAFLRSLESPRHTSAAYRL